MALHAHFDLDRAGRDIDAEIASGLEPKKGEPGQIGAQARLNIACSKAVHLALLAEINRGTSLEDIGSALACVAANAIASLSLFAKQAGFDPENVQAGMLSMIEEMSDEAMSHQTPGVSIEDRPHGTA